MQRRRFLYALSGLSLLGSTRALAQPAATPRRVTVMRFTDDGKPAGLGKLMHIVLAHAKNA